MKKMIAGNMPNRKRERGDTPAKGNSGNGQSGAPSMPGPKINPGTTGPRGRTVKPKKKDYYEMAKNKSLLPRSGTMRGKK